MRKLLVLMFIVFAVSHPAAAFKSDSRHVEYPTYSAHVNGLSIAYQDFGEARNGTVLLIMGLAAQLITWNDEIVHGLVDAGYRVIRFDNRDVGWSEKLHELPTPGLITGIRYKLGLSLGAPYKLDDMAADSVALVEYLNIQKVHVVGVSMGGMIAQIMAAKYPHRVASLTSIMSTSSAVHLPQGSVDLDFSRQGNNREEIIDGTVDLVSRFGGSVGTMKREVLHAKLARSHDRSNYGPGRARQLWAIMDSGDRVELLKTIRQPSVVLHGREDTLIPYQHGEHTAELIDGAKFVMLEGMGHYIDDANLPIIVDEIIAVASKSQ
ncbi:MAG: alpha/beta hydrolase [Arenicella sp.]|nr:alpha/beta hydrolase [Arenicella sp.]